MLKQILVTLLLLTTYVGPVSAQWRMPARQVEAATNNFGYIPNTKTNAQLIFDWLDDSWVTQIAQLGVSNALFTVIPSTATNGQLAIDAIDNLFATTWPMVFTNMPSITTNVFGFPAVFSNLDLALSGIYNTINSNADYVASNTPIVVSTALRQQPQARFWQYEETETDGQTINPGGSLEPLLSHSSTAHVYYAAVTNGFTHTTSGSDMYWTVPSNGLYLASMTMGAYVYGPGDSGAGSLDSWLTCNDATITNPAGSRTFMQTYQLSNDVYATYGRWWKGGGLAVLKWNAGDVIRLKAKVVGVAATGRVTFISFDAHRLGDY